MASDFEMFGFGAEPVALDLRGCLEGIARDVHSTDPAN